MSQRFVIVSILLMTLISMNQMSLSPPVSANSGDCQGDIPVVRWNETVSRYALTPSSAPDWWYEWEAYDDEPETGSRGHDGMMTIERKFLLLKSNKDQQDLKSRG